MAACFAAGGANAKSPKPKREPDPAASIPVGDPNGAWTIESMTTVGTCPALIPATLQIAENKIAAATGAEVASWGYVDEEGVIVARFTAEGERVARFHGQLRGDKGSGAWSSSTDLCGGTWRAWRTQGSGQ